MVIDYLYYWEFFDVIWVKYELSLGEFCLKGKVEFSVV